MFIAALFIIAKTQKQAKCPSDEWIKKMCVCVRIYINGILVIKKNEIMPFGAKWMDIEIIILNEVSQNETKVIRRYHLRVESKI